MDRCKGFTLTELMIIVAVLGVIAAVAIPQYLNYVERSKANTAESNYAAAVRFVKAEFTKAAAGQATTVATNAVAALGNGGQAKNPYNRHEPAFAAGHAPSRGQVAIESANLYGSYLAPAAVVVYGNWTGVVVSTVVQPE